MINNPNSILLSSISPKFIIDNYTDENEGGGLTSVSPLSD